jgi:hypothetical protein
MSMTSKVNPTLRQEILNLMASGIQLSNRAIQSRLGFRYSLRTIQEATQKMRDAGVLTPENIEGYTFYGVSPAVTEYIDNFSASFGQFQVA